MHTIINNGIVRGGPGARPLTDTPSCASGGPRQRFGRPGPRGEEGCAARVAGNSCDAGTPSPEAPGVGGNAWRSELTQNVSSSTKDNFRGSSSGGWRYQLDEAAPGQPDSRCYCYSARAMRGSGRAPPEHGEYLLQNLAPGARVAFSDILHADAAARCILGADTEPAVRPGGIQLGPHQERAPRAHVLQ